MAITEGSGESRGYPEAPLLSIIVPAYNEASGIAEFLQQLLAIVAQQKVNIELIVVDGGSTDSTAAIVGAYGVTCLQGPRGRARQMNFAATTARGRYLLFLHCDTALPQDFAQHLQQAVTMEATWGFFRLRLSGRAPAFRVIEWAISLRSARNGIGTGDQAIFVRRDVWQQIGGYGDMPLMEDVDLCIRLRQRQKPLVCNALVITSSRRWERHGVVTTVLLMWFLRACYFFGVSTRTLARWYR